MSTRFSPNFQQRPDCTRQGLRWSKATERCENPAKLPAWQLANRQGLGFAEYDYFEDEWGNYWDSSYFSDEDWDWLTGGGGSSGDYLFAESENPWSWLTSGGNSGNVTGFDQGFYDLLLDLGYSESDAAYYAFTPGGNSSDYTITNETEPAFQGSNQSSGGSIWDWLSQNWLDFLPGPGPAPRGPEIIDDQGAQLPGYCPRGTYHPLENPLACVPFPDDTAAKRQAAQQRKQGQAQAKQQRSAQQAANKQCPPDSQRRPVWRNPATNKCEVVPTCPTGAKFDQVTKQCLTGAQIKALYGQDNNWIWWVLAIAGGVYVITRRKEQPRGRRR